MKFSLLIGAAVAQQPQPSLPPGFTPPPGLLPGTEPAQEPISTQAPPPKDFDGARCPTQKWNENILVPQPSSGAYCPQFKCSSCCNDEKLMEHLGEKADKTIQYGPYHFEGCNSKGQKVDGSGQMGSACHEFIKNSHCAKSCDPNSYVYYPDETENGQQLGAHEIPTCDGFCSDFFAACRSEYLCYKADGMKQVLMDLIEGNFTEEYNYAAFRCDGEYSCEKLEDTIFGGSGMLYEGSGAFKEMINKLQKQQPDFQPYQHFCSRFSFKLYQPVTSSDSVCVDPREGSSMQAAVQRHQRNWNEENPENKRTYPATEPCATGLSVGAIVGIVIGCLAGVGLIAVAVYFLACKGDSENDDEGTYQAGAPASTNIDMPSSGGDIVKSASQRTDYDPNE